MSRRPSPALAAEVARLLAPAVKAHREARPVVEAGADASPGETPACPPAAGRGVSVGTAPADRAAPDGTRPPTGRPVGTPTK